MLYIQTHSHSLHSQSWNVRSLSVQALKRDHTVPRDGCLGLGTGFKLYGELDRFCPDVFGRPPQCKIARAHSRGRELKVSATLLYSGVLSIVSFLKESVSCVTVKVLTMNSLLG